MAIALVPIVEWAAGARAATKMPRSGYACSSCPLRSVTRSRLRARATARWRIATSVNRIAIAHFSEFEQALDEDSRLSQQLRPPAQIAMTRWLGAGKRTRLSRT